MCSPLDKDLSVQIKTYLDNVVKERLANNSLYFGVFSHQPVTFVTTVTYEDLFRVKDYKMFNVKNGTVLQNNISGVLEDTDYVRVYNAVIKVLVEGKHLYSITINDVNYGGQCGLSEAPQFDFKRVVGSLNTCLKQFKVKPKYWG